MNFEQHNSTYQSLHHYKEGLGNFTQQIPEITEAYNTFTQGCFQEGTFTI